MAPGDSLVVEFTTSSPSTGATVDADSLPTAVLARNGTDDGAVTVTVTHIDTGRYKASCTIPSGYSNKDAVQVMATATVNAITGKDSVFQTNLDTEPVPVLFGSSGSVTHTITVFDEDGVTPLSGVSVYVSSDSSGVLRSQAQLTDAAGRARFQLDPGTIYAWPSRYDRTFNGAPYVETVS